MQELLEYDKAVEREERTEFDATAGQLKVERSMTKVGTRKTSATRKPPVRKENPKKEQFITELSRFLQEKATFLGISDIQIVNKEREILFKVDGDWHSLVFSFRRNMNK